MKKEHVKLGRKVIAIKPVVFFPNLVGKIGTICDLGYFEEDKTGEIGVSFDEKFNGGHSCNDNCEYGHGRYGRLECFQLLGSVNNPNIIVV